MPCSDSLHCCACHCFSIWGIPVWLDPDCRYVNRCRLPHKKCKEWPTVKDSFVSYALRSFLSSQMSVSSRNVAAYMCHIYLHQGGFVFANVVSNITWKVQHGFWWNFQTTWVLGQETVDDLEHYEFVLGQWPYIPLWRSAHSQCFSSWPLFTFFL